MPEHPRGPCGGARILVAQNNDQAGENQRDGVTDYGENIAFL
jgi:hypothetical protein